MRVVRYDRFAGIDQLYVDEAPPPVAGAGQVLVRVEASCLNPGSLSALNGSPYTPIRDIAGTVVGVGDGVDSRTVGDEVLGWAQDWSAHAEIVAVAAEQVVPKPGALTWDVAGSLFVTPMAGLGALEAVDPQAGEVLVIAGATGGVGLTVGQLARRRGVAVIGIAGPSGADRLGEFGISAVSYTGDVAAAVREAAGGRSVAAFVDAFGSGYVDLALELGVPADRINTVVDYQAAKEKGVKAHGTMDAGGAPALCELAELAATGVLVVPIASTYPLDEVQAAYRELATGRANGRVVLHPQE